MSSYGVGKSIGTRFTDFFLTISPALERCLRVALKLALFPVRETVLTFVQAHANDVGREVLQPNAGQLQAQVKVVIFGPREAFVKPSDLYEVFAPMKWVLGTRVDS
jgi:hypothetical protein